MSRWIGLGLWIVGMLCMNGCAITPEQRVSLEKKLNQEVNSFIDNTVHSNWDADYALTTGQWKSADQLKVNLQSSLPENSTVTGGDIVSMAWEDDQTAKVKINWAFLQGSTTGFSCETFIWVLKGTIWKYQGRSIR